MAAVAFSSPARSAGASFLGGGLGSRMGSRTLVPRAPLSRLVVMNLIGDVKGKVAVLVDDMVDTAATSPQQEGANAVFACSCCFQPPCNRGGLFQEVIIADTIPLADHNYYPQLTVLSVGNLLAEPSVVFMVMAL